MIKSASLFTSTTFRHAQTHEHPHLVHTVLTTANKFLRKRTHKHTQCTQTGTEEVSLGEAGNELHHLEMESSIHLIGDNEEALEQRQATSQDCHAPGVENDAERTGRSFQGYDSARAEVFCEIAPSSRAEASSYSKYPSSPQLSSADHSDIQMRGMVHTDVSAATQVTESQLTSLDEEATILSDHKKRLIDELENLDCMIKERLDTVKRIDQSTVGATQRLDKVRELLRVEEKFVRNGQSQLKMRLREMLQHESRMQREVEERRLASRGSAESMQHGTGPEYSLVADTASGIAREDSSMTFEEDSLCVIEDDRS